MPENGSTLRLNGVNLYAAVGGVMMHINPLVTPGVPLNFGNGFLEAGTVNDMDADGVADNLDNCVLQANPDQRDTDGDGFGNRCDLDIAPQPNDGIVENADLNALKLAFFTQPGDPAWNPDADFNGDATVDFLDLNQMKLGFFGTPGPTCVTP